MTNDRADSAIFSQLAAELLAGGISFRFQAKGRSMIPTIADGDVLHVESVNPRGLKLGDIALSQQGAEFKAHRIIGKRGDLFIIRGDAGVAIDVISPEQIVGKVIAKECRDSGRVTSISGPKARAEFFWRALRRRMRSVLSCRRIEHGERAVRAPRPRTSQSHVAPGRASQKRPG